MFPSVPIFIGTEKRTSFFLADKNRPSISQLLHYTLFWQFCKEQDGDLCCIKYALHNFYHLYTKVSGSFWAYLPPDFSLKNSLFLNVFSAHTFRFLSRTQRVSQHAPRDPKGTPGRISDYF